MNEQTTVASQIAWTAAADLVDASKALEPRARWLLGVAVQAQAIGMQRDAIAAMRRDGASWAKVAEVTGTTRQAAAQRYRVMCTCDGPYPCEEHDNKS